jgi:ferredoxin
MPHFHIVIERDTCIGDKMCCCEAPNTFAMDDEDKAQVINAEGDAPEAILAAAKTCPVDCIQLTECESGRKVWPES